MTEFELKQALGQEIELPKAVEERLHQACTQAAAQSQPVRRKRPLRAARVAVVAAAIGATLYVGALAVSFASHGAVYQAFFGNEAHPSQAYTGGDSEKDKLWFVNEERVPVDEELAAALVGAYLSEEEYTWQIGDYTLTVEGYLLDENTGTAMVSYSLYHPGGLDIIVDEQTGDVDFYNGIQPGGAGILPVFRVLCNNPESPSYGKYVDLGVGGQADLTRTTADTLYMTTLLGNIGDTGWKAADGLRIAVLEPCKQDFDVMADMDTLAELDLPGLESVPAITLSNPETGEPAAVISPIGMQISIPYPVEAHKIVLTYDDGSTYVVADFENRLMNADLVGNHDLDDTTMPRIGLTFNRLVDPEQVASVTIDGQTYAVK